MRVFSSIFLFFLLIFPLWEITFANAPPEYFIVRGKIVDGNLLPRQGDFDIRVSLWMGADANDSDPTDISAALWWDVYAVTLEADGRFEVQVGSANALPDPFSFDTYKYIQLDAKPAAETEYSILDPIMANNGIDRLNLLTIPFKSTLEDFVGRTLGFGAGDVPYLDGIGELPESTMPSSITTLLTSLDAQVQAISQGIQDSPWKGVVADQATLPDPGSSFMGEVRYVVDQGELHAFDGTEWKSTSKRLENKTVGKTMNTLADLITIDTDLAAVPGVFYWDSENKEYYIGQADGSLQSLFGEGNLSQIVEEIWVDLRTADLAQLNIEKTTGEDIVQDSQYGIEMPVTGNKWKAGFSFPEAIIDRSLGKTFEFVIYTGNQSGEVMVGVVDPAVNLDAVNIRKDQLQQISLHMESGNDSSELFGRMEGDVEYIRTYTKSAPWGANKFYKITFDINPTIGLAGNLRIDEIDPNDWETSIYNLVDDAVSNNSDIQFLEPAWFVKGASEYYFTGFRVKDINP